MRSLLPIGALFLLIATLACGDTVDMGGTGATLPNGGAGGAGGTSAVGGGGVGGNGSAVPHEGIAVFYHQLLGSSSGSSTSTTSSSSSAGGLDPEMLFIILSNTALDCGDPSEAVCDKWAVWIGIPPSLQVLGHLPLSTSGVASHYSDDDGSCFGSSSAPFNEGTLELTSLSSQEVSGVLSNTSTNQVDVNGSFTVPRCP